MKVQGLHLKQFVDSIITRYFSDDLENIMLRKIIMLNLISIIGIVVIFSFGCVAFHQSIYGLGFTDFMAGILLMLNLFYFWESKHYHIASHIGIFMAGAFFLYLFASGGAFNTGPLWYYTFPLFSCYLLGSKRGAIASLILITISILFLYINKNTAFFSTYQKNFLLRFFPSYFVVFAYSYLYEYMTEKKQEELRLMNTRLDRKVAEQTIDLNAKNISLNLKIEEYKTSQDALRKSEERFRDLADMLPQTVFELDDSGNITFANRMAFTIFEYTQEDFYKGLNALQMFVPEERDKIMAYMQQVLGGEVIEHLESTAQTKNGSAFPVLVYPRVIMDKYIPVGIRGILIDITAQKKAEENRRKIEAQLQKALKMATMGQMASGLLYEINQPLSGVYGHIQLMQHDGKLNEPLQERLQIVLGVIERMTRMMDQFRLISHTSKAEFVPVSLKDAVHSIRNLFEHQIRTNNIRCSIEIQEGVPAILGDTNDIQQIVSNLMINAICALECKEDGSRDILIKMQHRDDTVILDFEDTGCGMPEDVQARIFDPFFTTWTSREGSGLGMVIVEAILHKHQATINFESKVGVGTRFSIEFPVPR